MSDAYQVVDFERCTKWEWISLAVMNYAKFVLWIRNNRRECYADMPMMVRVHAEAIVLTFEDDKDLCASLSKFDGQCSDIAIAMSALMECHSLSDFARERGLLKTMPEEAGIALATAIAVADALWDVEDLFKLTDEELRERMRPSTPTKH